ERMHQLGWSEVHSVYDDPSLRRFLTEPFNRHEVAGRIPRIGDANVDRATIDPLRRLPVPPRISTVDTQLDSQHYAAWVRLVHSDDPMEVAQELRDSFGDHPIVPPKGYASDRWAVYNITSEHMKMIEQLEPSAERFETGPIFYGGKGLALLRGGKGSHRHGA